MPQSASPSPKPQRATLRLAQTSDAEAIGILGATVFNVTFGWSLPPSDLETYLKTSYSTNSILNDLTNPSMTTFVAVSPQNKIVGFTQMNRASYEPCIEDSPKPVELQRLYVDTSFHGGGVGRMLVEGIENLAKEEGYETLWLGVWEENFKSIGFYKKVGFEECGFHDFKMGECVQTDLIVKKAI